MQLDTDITNLVQKMRVGKIMRGIVTNSKNTKVVFVASAACIVMHVIDNINSSNNYKKCNFILARSWWRKEFCG